MKRFGLILLSSFFALTASAADINDLFVNAPQHIFPLLDTNARMDMLDLYAYKMEANVENRYEGRSMLKYRNDSSLMVLLTDASTWELHLFPRQDDTLLVCIHTIATPMERSRIAFYDKNWALQDIVLETPDFDDFWQFPDSVSFAEREATRSLLTPAWQKIAFSPENEKITYSLSLEGLSSDNRKKVESYVKSLGLLWNGKEFIRKESEN